MHERFRSSIEAAAFTREPRSSLPDTRRAELLATLDITKTAFLLVSKGGNTVEMHVWVQLLLSELSERRALGDIAERFRVITVPEGNPLHRLSADYHIPLLPHATHLGGRFSILSPVGLIPAAYMRLDIRALREGARLALSHLYEAAHGAALQYLLLKRGYQWLQLTFDSM